jgi:hypothetical protein
VPKLPWGLEYSSCGVLGTNFDKPRPLITFSHLPSKRQKETLIKKEEKKKIGSLTAIRGQDDI